jgi:hypothetical protein
VGRSSYVTKKIFQKNKRKFFWEILKNFRKKKLKSYSDMLKDQNNHSIIQGRINCQKKFQKTRFLLFKNGKQIEQIQQLLKFGKRSIEVFERCSSLNLQKLLTHQEFKRISDIDRMVDYNASWKVDNSREG